MSDHELQLLVLGAGAGVYLTLLGQGIGWIIADRRNRKAEQAAQAQLKAAQERAKA